MKDILREIISDKPNIIKRKLKIYNFLNDTNYKLEDFGFMIDKYEFNINSDISVFYYFKEVDFTYNKYGVYFRLDKIDLYKQDYITISNYIKLLLEGIFYERDNDFPDHLFVYGKDSDLLFICELTNNLIFLNNYIRNFILNYSNFNILEIVRIFDYILKDYDKLRDLTFLTVVNRFEEIFKEKQMKKYQKLIEKTIPK